jgi:hypothetical protein
MHETVIGQAGSQSLRQWLTLVLSYPLRKVASEFLHSPHYFISLLTFALTDCCLYAKVDIFPDDGS